MTNQTDATKPFLRIRVNASENVKGIVSCEATVELVTDVNDIENVTEIQQSIAEHIETQLTKMHIELRSHGHKLAVDGGV